MENIDRTWAYAEMVMGWSEAFLLDETVFMAAEIDTDSTFKAGIAKELFQRVPFTSESIGSTGISWDNHPDDKKFLVIKSAEILDDETISGPPRKIKIIRKRFEELKERESVD